jgi:G3E family GTPase
MWLTNTQRTLAKKKKTLTSIFSEIVTSAMSTFHFSLNPARSLMSGIPGDEPSRPVLALVGGFLGAGKTTLIGKTVARFHQRGLRCAVVSNDQSVGLVDGVSAKLLGGAAVGEVTGACFCCKLDDLAQVVERLRAEERPDVILCEPVGSCTDLVATVVRPLEKIYQMEVSITPFTVVLDGRRALAAYGGAKRKKDFAKDVGYIFRKQVEEAEALFLNKVEMLTAAEHEALRGALEKAFPEKRLWFGSAKADEGVREWMEECLGLEEDKGGSLASSLTERRYRQSMDIDYGVYARGEAMLGWYNAELSFRTDAPVDGNAWLLARADEIAGKLEEAGCEVAHFKMSLEKTEDCKTQDTREKDAQRVAIVNQVMSGENPALSREMSGGIDAGILLVNLRAEGDAGLLKSLVREVLEGHHGISLNWRNEAAFQPGEPKPTHRILAEAL